MKRLVGFYLPSKNLFIDLPWTEEHMIKAKVGYHLIQRLMQDKQGRAYLNAPEDVFHMLGITFVESQDNIFHHKKCFMQDIADLLDIEVKFFLETKNKKANNRRTVRE